MFDVNEFIDDAAKQLSQSIVELHDKDMKIYSLTKAVLMGIYTQGYRDANLERERTAGGLSKASDLWEKMNK